MEYRHELKFYVPEITLEKLKYRLDAIMELDSNQTEQEYTIRSLYFDDYGDTCYNETLAGKDNRYKYRIRFYRGNLDYINLEKKYKLHGMTKKESQNINIEQVKAYLAGDADKAYELGLLGHGNTSLNAENRRMSEMLTTQLLAANLKSGMRPKCIVEYDRCAYVEPIGNVRITFDRNIRGSRDIDRFLDTSEEFTMPVLPPEMHILEVKYDEFLPKHILQLIDINSLHRQSFSKYTTVREELG